MCTVIRSETRYSRKPYAARKTIAADTFEELPAGDELSTFIQGSVAWVLSTGDIYGLSASGEWIKQEKIILAL